MPRPIIRYVLCGHVCGVTERRVTSPTIIGAARTATSTGTIYVVGAGAIAGIAGDAFSYDGLFDLSI